MTQQVINIGASEGDGTGDKARIFTDKINDNFVELYTAAPGRYVTADSYGAVGNGSTDDTVAVQAALTACSTYGMTCILTTGKTYKITSELYLWGRANLFSWSTTSTAFGSLRFSTGTTKYLVNVGISGVSLPQEPWSGTIKNCDFTMVSASGSHRIIYFWRTDGGVITGNTGDAGTYQLSLTSSGNDAAVLSSGDCIRRNITITENVFRATGVANLGSEGIGLASFDGALIARNRIIGVGDDPIGIHYSNNIVITDNCVSSVDGRIYVSNGVDVVISNNDVTRCIGGDAAWYTGIALIYVGHESTSTNSRNAPTRNTIINNRLTYNSGAIDSGAAIQVLGARQVEVKANTIVNNSASVTAVAFLTVPVTMVGTWTDPSGIDTTVAKCRDITVTGNTAIGAYPQSFSQTGTTTDNVGPLVVANNIGSGFGFSLYPQNHVSGNTTGDLTIVTYSASMTFDASAGPFQITATDTNAMTINNPVNVIANNNYQPGTQLTINMRNTSGGAMGAITWGANFLLAGAFTNPATGKNRSITFLNTSIVGVANKWTEIYRTAADVTN